MGSCDVGQRLQPQWSGIALVRGPRLQKDFRNRTHHLRIVAEGQLRPLVGNRLGRQVRVPCQSSKSIEVGHRQMIGKPVWS